MNDEQYERPEAEYGFDFPEEMPQARVRGPGVRQMFEVARREGVQDRQREQGGADDFECSDGQGHATEHSRLPDRRRQSKKSPR